MNAFCCTSATDILCTYTSSDPCTDSQAFVSPVISPQSLSTPTRSGGAWACFVNVMGWDEMTCHDNRTFTLSFGCSCISCDLCSYVSSTCLCECMCIYVGLCLWRLVLVRTRNINVNSVRVICCDQLEKTWFTKYNNLLLYQTKNRKGESSLTWWRLFNIESRNRREWGVLF